MTDISREAVEREVAGLRFLHKSTCIENRLPPKDCTTSHSRAADMILALRAALDAAEADKARAVEVERDRCIAAARGALNKRRAAYMANHERALTMGSDDAALFEHSATSQDWAATAVVDAIRARHTHP